MLRLGMALPHFGADAKVESIVQVAVEAERIGLDSIWVMDRLIRPHAPVSLPGGPRISLPSEYATVFDPLDTLAFVAAHTSRVQLGTSAILALHQHPLILARRLATVDQLSRGRLVTGVVQGWMAEELITAGIPPDDRGARFDEHLATIRALWRPDPVEHAGRFYTVPLSDVGPKPFRPEGIPLLMGYVNSAGIKRAARVSDGLHPYTNDTDKLRRDLAEFREAARQRGRDLARLTVVLRVDWSLEDRPVLAADRQLFNGTLDQWCEDVAGLRELGVSHVLFGVGASVPDQLDVLARLRARIPNSGGELAARPTGPLSSPA